MVDLLCTRAAPPGHVTYPPPPPLLQRPLLSCRGVCYGDAHPLVLALTAPFVLAFHAVTIYLLPAAYLYLHRFSRALVAVLCGPCRARGWFLFTDREFAGARALGKADADVDWVRASNLARPDESKPMVLFDARIDPKDLHQGQLGDCWLIAAVSCVAEFPAAIRNVFVDAEATESGAYRVRLFDTDAKRWRIVLIDDLVPCAKGTREPIYTRPHNGEMWTVLLEKAFAKFFGSYAKLDGNRMERAWEILTGDAVFSLSQDGAGAWSRGSEVLSPDQLFLALQSYDRHRCVVGASRRKTARVAREQQRDDGVFAGHAYSVLTVRRAGVAGLDHLRDSGASGVKMVLLRNPWGRGEWHGKWSRRDAAWKAHPAIARELGHVGADESKEEDGTFWMEFSDFVATFQSVSVCSRTTKGDLRLNAHEELPLVGPCVGCATGCFYFWCCCRGLRVVYCGEHSSEQLKEGDQCCVPVGEIARELGVQTPGGAAKA